MIKPMINCMVYLITILSLLTPMFCQMMLSGRIAVLTCGHRPWKCPAAINLALDL